MRVPRRAAASSCVVAVVLAVVVWAPADGSRAQEASSPSVVVILTDDQRADELTFMSSVQRRLMRRGLTFERSFVTDPFCCPSRATLLTGLHAHTTGVWSNRGPEGGWSVFDQAGLERRTIAVELHRAGYRTAYVGKYLNGYAAADGAVPPGWDRWFVFDGQNGAYYDYDIVKAGPAGTERLSFGSDDLDYSTDVLAEQAVTLIEETPSDVPLFLMVSPYAPHGPPKPAPRHDGALDGVALERSPSYAERRVRDKPRYIRQLPIPLARPFPMSRLRSRTETLLAADELVGDVVRALRASGRLESTMIIYSSDNGYLLGEHRWGYKIVPYEESIKVPLVIRYDPLTSGRTTTALAANVDIAPTIAELAGVGFDAEGRSLLPILRGDGPVRTSVLLESREYTPSRFTTVPSYCGVRMKTKVFVRYATGEEEYYTLRTDPYQLDNQAGDPSRPLRRLRRITKELCQPVPPLFSWGR